MAGKWWILRDGGAGEPGEAAEGHGAQENFFLHAPATTTNGAKITPVSPISRCPRAFHRVVRARRPAARPAAWPGRASRRLAGPGRPPGRPLFTRWPAAFSAWPLAGRPAYARPAAWSAALPPGQPLFGRLRAAPLALRAARPPCQCLRRPMSATMAVPLDRWTAHGGRVQSVGVPKCC